MELKLLDTTQDILDLILDLTGKPVEFILKPGMQTLAAVKIARESMPAHIIYYKDSKYRIMNHLVAHECGHIHRMMSVPAEYRKVPATNSANKRMALEHLKNELMELSKTIPVNQLGQLTDIWFEGIVTQVTNISEDMRIEKWIFDNYPKLRQVQKTSIDKQMRDNAQALSNRIKNMTPKHIYDANNYMNYAFAYFMGSLLSKNYITPYKRTPYIELGTKLADLVIETEDHGYKQDIEIIDKWVNMLDLDGWFFWTDFETIPSDYLEQW